MASISENKITLSPREMPRSWYNLAADLPFRIPPMMSPSGYPITSRELEPLFPLQIRQQELESRQRSFRIPPEVKSAYAQWRPTPMFRARKLEELIGTPAACTTSSRAAVLPVPTSRTPRYLSRTTSAPGISAPSSPAGQGVSGSTPLATRAAFSA